MHENSVSCITATDGRVYLGTNKGSCLSFCNTIGEIQLIIEKSVSEHAIDGIVCTQQCVWVSCIVETSRTNADLSCLQNLFLHNYYDIMTVKEKTLLKLTRTCFGLAFIRASTQSW